MNEKGLFYILIVVMLMVSCRNSLSKDDFEKYMVEIKELNTILISKSSRMNEVDNSVLTISKVYMETEDLIKELNGNLNLIEIDLYYIGGDTTNLGMVYRFENERVKDAYYYMVFSKDATELDRFLVYEQFSECSDQFTLEPNWAWVKVRSGCNN